MARHHLNPDTIVEVWTTYVEDERSPHVIVEIDLLENEASSDTDDIDNDNEPEGMDVDVDETSATT